MQRSIRGATTVDKDTRQNVISVTKELLQQIIRCNDVNTNDIVNIVFTATTDIKSEFPAVAACELGLVDVPLIDCQQMMRDGVLEYCIRVMLTYNTEKTQTDIKHIYLRGAEVLRPDLLKKIEGEKIMWLLENIDMKRSKYILPSLFTSASLLFAFLAIIAALNGNFVSSAVYMLLAGFADAFDGRVARYTHTQTEFGAALDSLADVVSFGATPALVMYFWSLHNIGALGAAISFLYLLAVALRLAKFDTMPAGDNSEESIIERRLYFYGMPCPAGAVTISGLIWMGQRTFVGDYAFITVILTTFTALYLAFMMISDIKFRSFKDSDGKGNISKLYVICFILIILMLFTMPDKLLYLIMIGYALSGPISHYRYKAKIKNINLNEESLVDSKKIIDIEK